MADAISSCVHCGFCLPTCPTYVTLGEEMDSPRGRIVLMKDALEGQIGLDDALPFIDNCLGCQACETACPSGVKYGDLLTSFRAHAEPIRTRSPIERARRELILRTLPYPSRFRIAARLGILARPVSRMLPRSLSTMLGLLPKRLPKTPPLPAVYPAEGPRRARVALLTGCAQDVLAPEVNWATLRVLARNGVETVIPSGQGCCGALAMHTGAAHHAKLLALRNLDAFGSGLDAIIATAAGCSSAMKEYGLLFKDEGSDRMGAAEAFSSRVVDISVFLESLGLVRNPPPSASVIRVAYHDPCHLAHAQGVRTAPRALLGAIENVTVVEPADWQLCCGSAGTYNVDKPEIAGELGQRKARSLLATGADVIVTGNVGCIVQLRTHLRALGHRVPVLHTVQFLDEAYGKQ